MWTVILCALTFISQVNPEPSAKNESDQKKESKSIERIVEKGNHWFGNEPGNQMSLFHSINGSSNWLELYMYRNMTSFQKFSNSMFGQCRCDNAIESKKEKILVGMLILLSMLSLTSMILIIAWICQSIVSQQNMSIRYRIDSKPETKPPAAPPGSMGRSPEKPEIRAPEKQPLGIPKSSSPGLPNDKPPTEPIGPISAVTGRRSADHIGEFEDHPLP
ncbi:uncharacterized protein O3C94_010611 [Discoglossus pictus]